MGSQKRVQWIYSSKNKWAKDYDKDLDQDFGWSGPRKAAEVFAVHVPKDSRILDAGSGTGLVGQRLAANGYHSLVAMDLSQGMLEASRKKTSISSSTKWSWENNWVSHLTPLTLSSVSAF